MSDATPTPEATEPTATDATKAALADFAAAQNAHAESNGHHNAKVLCRIALAALKAIEKPAAALAKAIKEAEAWCEKNAPAPAAK